MLPGDPVSQDAQDRLLTRLRERIQREYPGLWGRSIPLACYDVGRTIDLLDALQQCPSEEMYCVFEPFPFEVRYFRKSSAIEYFSMREPWEDYDLILSSPAADWVVSLSHNEKSHQLIDDVTSSE